MSNQALTWAFAQSTGNAGRKAVLVALADKADERHSCWPDQDTLAGMTDQSPRAVRGHLRELERAGFITRQARRNKAGHRTSDRYVLAVNVAVGLTKPAEPRKAKRQDRPVGQAAGSAGSLAAESAGRHLALAADSVDSYRQDLPGNPQENPQPTPAVSEARATTTTSTTSTTKRGTRLPDDWRRSPADVAWQHGEVNIPDAFAYEATAEFRDYWRAQPGQRGVKLDWSATWRNWMRRAWRGREGEQWRRAQGQAPVRDFDAERADQRVQARRRSPLAGAR